MFCISKFIIKKQLDKTFDEAKLNSAQKKALGEVLDERYARISRVVLLQNLLMFLPLVLWDAGVLLHVSLFLMTVTVVSGFMLFGASYEGVSKKQESIVEDISANLINSFATSLLLFVQVIIVSALKSKILLNSPFSGKFMEALRSTSVSVWILYFVGAILLGSIVMQLIWAVAKYRVLLNLNRS